MRITLEVRPSELDWGKSTAQKEVQSADMQGHQEIWEMVDYDLDIVKFEGRECEVHEDDIDEILRYLVGGEE
ncbi:MAG: hypothetical protein L7U64_03920 [Luminiphilus sp.]|nr:hypothetical protein [Luminiphilus sp.]